MHEPVEIRERGLALGHREGREAIAQRLEGESAARRDLDGALEGVGEAGEAALELAEIVQVPLAVGLETSPGRRQGRLLADAGLHVVDLPRLGPGVARVLADHAGHDELAAQAREGGEALVVAGPQVVGELQVGALPEGVLQAVGPGARRSQIPRGEGAVDGPAASAREHHQPAGVMGDLFPGGAGAALGVTQARRAEDPTGRA